MVVVDIICAIYPYSDSNDTDSDNDTCTNINIYWISLNLMYPMDELWTTGFLKYVIPYLSGGRLGNARTTPGCIYRSRVSLDSFACTS